MSLCHSMCYTRSGELVVSGQTKAQKKEIHVYNRQGQLKRTLDRPPEYYNCKIDSMVEVSIAGKRYIVTSCSDVRQLTLHDLSSGRFTAAWKGGGEGQIKPCRICLGGPGELLAIDVQSYDEQNVVVFDITSTQFTIKHTVDGMMNAAYLCYREDPCHGGVVYTTDTARGFRLCATSMKTGDRLWYVGGIDESPESKCIGGQILVAGKPWTPNGICVDDKGHLYITDVAHNRIVVVEASQGRVLGILTLSWLKGRCLWDPIWADQEKNLIVWHRNLFGVERPEEKATFFKINFNDISHANPNQNI